MGSDYSIVCNKCKKYGGGFSRQAWGTGNAKIIDTFRFLMKHGSSCDGDFSIIDDQYLYDSEELKPDFDKDLLGYYPHSNEWDKEINEKEYAKYISYNKRD